MTTRRSRRNTNSNYRTPANASVAVGSSRHDFSLGVLTRKFLGMLDEAGGRLDLNDAVSGLHVQKRRIYDITNVLEGIGIISKSGKNVVEYTPAIGKKYVPPKSSLDEGCTEAGLPNDLEDDVKKLRQEVERLKAIEREVDSFSSHLWDLIIEIVSHRVNKMRLYITDTDVASLPVVGPEDQVIAILAPQGTSLEIPEDSDKSKADVGLHHKILISSRREPIELWQILGMQNNLATAEQLKDMDVSDHMLDESRAAPSESPDAGMLYTSNPQGMGLSPGMYFPSHFPRPPLSHDSSNHLQYLTSDSTSFGWTNGALALLESKDRDAIVGQPNQENNTLNKTDGFVLAARQAADPKDASEKLASEILTSGKNVSEDKSTLLSPVLHVNRMGTNSTEPATDPAALLVSSDSTPHNHDDLTSLGFS